MPRPIANSKPESALTPELREGEQSEIQPEAFSGELLDALIENVLIPAAAREHAKREGTGTAGNAEIDTPRDGA